MGVIFPGLEWDGISPKVFSWDLDGTRFSFVGVGREKFENPLSCHPLLSTTLFHNALNWAILWFLEYYKSTLYLHFPNTVVKFKSCQYFSPGVPNWMQFSNVRTKSASLSLTTWRLLDFSMFFSHLLAWPWGSIIRGHLLALLQATRQS